MNKCQVSIFSLYQLLEKTFGTIFQKCYYANQLATSFVAICGPFDICYIVVCLFFCLFVYLKLDELKMLIS